MHAGQQASARRTPFGRRRARKSLSSPMGNSKGSPWRVARSRSSNLDGAAVQWGAARGRRRDVSGGAAGQPSGQRGPRRLLGLRGWDTGLPAGLRGPTAATGLARPEREAPGRHGEDRLTSYRHDVSRWPHGGCVHPGPADRNHRSLAGRRGAKRPVALHVTHRRGQRRDVSSVVSRREMPRVLDSPTRFKFAQSLRAGRQWHRPTGTAGERHGKRCWAARLVRRREVRGVCAGQHQ